MQISVGTFNLNNLFSRWNFQSSISTRQSNDVNISYEFNDPDNIKVRTFQGRLIKQKNLEDTQTIADRIIALDIDVLAVQEVENISILKEFNRVYLNGMYNQQTLLEGNDPRFIDIGILSKLPIGGATSFRTATHPTVPNQTVFGRDLLEVEILSKDKSRKLFTLYNNHLKSHYGDDDNNGAGRRKNNKRRKQQAEMVSKIIGKRMKTNSKFILTGDMNDGPGDAPIRPMLTIDGIRLTNGLANAQETRPAKPETDPSHNPSSQVWTHRFKKARQPADYKLFDQIWLSKSISSNLVSAHIDRRTKHGGDGSDHDPAWVVLNI